jgi:ribonuclease HI
MELKAVLKGVEALAKTDCNPKEDELEIISDSMYVIKGSTEWVDKWKEHEWKTLTGKDVKNQDLWLKIIKIKETYLNLKFNWVKGHDSDKFNIECDAMCQAKIREGVAEVQNAGN